MIEYAAILYPGPSQHFGDDVAALEAVGGREAGLRMELDAVLASALGVRPRNNVLNDMRH